MKTQISRDSFDPTKHYSGVYLQQGRMIVDADVNELTDIAKARLDAALADAIGSGAPRVGALAIVAAGAGQAIQPGELFVDGIRARLDGAGPIAPASQPDYRNAPTLPAKNLRFYADVWERPVTALEDAALQDSGLHGADTATRSKTMLQVKWCDTGTDPTNPAVNPPLGNALLTLQLRKITSSGDACNLCAEEVAVDERIGNYLFRVEVHDVFMVGTSQHLVLKWSRDNGAEAYPVGAYPDGFDQGAWEWEFFDGDSENLAGHHFPLGEPRRRGLISDSFQVPVGSVPHAFVRQWDGYAEFDLGAGALVKGMERGVALSGAIAATAQSYVRVDAVAGTIAINLELMQLTLAYRDGAGPKRFVAGDFWQVPVREAVDVSGDTVLANAAPHGVPHHYLVLAEVDATGAIVPFSDARHRQMNFPPLTDIRAADIGFTSNCDGLYAGAQNVQKAFDALCNLGAEDIGYTLPGCGTPAAPSVASLMTAVVPHFPDVDGQPKSPSVKDMLDALMCSLAARVLPYDPGVAAARWTDINDANAAPPLTVQQALDDLVNNLDASDVPQALPPCVDATNSGSGTLRELLGVAPGAHTVMELLQNLYCNLRATHIPLDRSKIQCTAILSDPTVTSVQGALDKLCASMGQGCEVSVPAGQLQQVLLNFAASSAQHLAICLLPGDQPITQSINLANKGSLTIKAQSSAASTIHMQASCKWGAQTIVLDGVTIYFSSAVQLELDCTYLTGTRGYFSRFSATNALQPMIFVNNPYLQLDWRNNYMQCSWTIPAGQSIVGKYVGSDVVGNVDIANQLQQLANSQAMVTDPIGFDKALDTISAAIAALPVATRTQWATAVRNTAPPAISVGLPPPRVALAAGAPVAKAAAAGTRAAKTQAASKTTGHARAAVAVPAPAPKPAAARARKAKGLLAPPPQMAVFARSVAHALAGASAAALPIGTVGPIKPVVTLGPVIGPVAGIVGNLPGGAVPVSTIAPISQIGAPNAVLSFADTLVSAGATPAAIKASLLGDFFNVITISGAGIALALSPYQLQGSLSSNTIVGEVVLMNGLQFGAAAVDGTSVAAVTLKTGLVNVLGGHFAIQGNAIGRLWPLVPPPDATTGALSKPIAGLWHCVVDGNSFTNPTSGVVADSIAFSNNQFQVYSKLASGAYAPFARLLGNQVTATGNLSVDQGASTPAILTNATSMKGASNFPLFLTF